MLIYEWGNSLELIDHERALFGRDLAGAAGSANLSNHLLVIARVQSILRLHGGKLQVEIARLGQIVLLHAGMGQEFQNFAGMGSVARLLQKTQNRFQGFAVFPHMPNHDVQTLENFGGIRREQRIRVLLKKLEGLSVRAAGHQRVGIVRQGFFVVVNGEKLVGQHARLWEMLFLQVGLHQVLQSLDMLVEICNLLQKLDRILELAGFDRIVSAQEQDGAIRRINSLHLLQDFVGGIQLAVFAQRLRGLTVNFGSIAFLAEAEVHFR